MYNYFRSCIYIFLIIEIIMNLPVTADNRVTQFVLDLLSQTNTWTISKRYVTLSKSIIL